MASADPFAVTPERIDHTLSWLEEEWGRRVPQYVRDWASWTEDEKLAFVVEAGIREDYLHQAEKWAAEGLLAPRDLDRFRRIDENAQCNRKVLQPLLDED